MAEKPCPHCSKEPIESRGRDFGWSCHRRRVEQTPTRESPNYRWGQLPDHSDSGLYLHGPADPVGLWAYQADQLGDEAVALDPEYGQRLAEWQQRDARRNFVQWLAIHKEHWGYVRFAVAMHKGNPEKVKEFTGWLESARRMRERLLVEAKKEAARLATR